MTTKVVKTIKQITLFSVLFMGMLSCETDIENLGTNIVENGVFDTQQYDSELKAYNQNILKNRANNLGQYLLGVYKNDDFGQLDASIITQVSSPSGFTDFGTNPVIDEVILSMPYHSTYNGLKEVQDPAGTIGELINVPDYTLDSIIGDQSVEYYLNVYELTSYLNTLNPSDPSEELEYFTDQTYSFNSTALHSELFSPSENDTIIIIDRPEVILDFTTMEFDKDTIKSVNAAPSIRLPLDKSFFNNFLTNEASLQSAAAFVDFFRGLYIEATTNTDSEASLLSIDLANVSDLTIYYTNTIITDETVEGVDLNNDGSITATADVRTKQSAVFALGGVATNTYTRDYASSNAETFLNSPNTTDGDERLYLQGASGSLALIDLFTSDDIEDLRNNDWLINEASLTFYVDQGANTSIAPEQLFVYNYDENEQITDMLTEGPTEYGGVLERDEDTNEPIKYTINITDYISEILKSTDPIEPSQLAVKVYNTSDLPTGFTDVEIRDFSWTPKGIVIHGNQSSDIDKRIKLEITYTELN